MRPRDRRGSWEKAKFQRENIARHMGRKEVEIWDLDGDRWAGINGTWTEICIATWRGIWIWVERWKAHITEFTT